MPKEIREYSFENQFAEALLVSMSAILERLIAEGAIAPGNRSVPAAVAISGGPDSTALLIGIAAIAERLSLTPIACHVNHGLRGSQSEEDAEFCRALSESLNVDFDSRLAGSPSEGTHLPEEELRETRYLLLSEMCGSAGAPLLMTAHTLDDQVETVLFRMLRGTSLDGLKGIAGARELSAGSRVWLVRPLLEATKKNCMRFLAESTAAHRLDSSNLDVRYRRNYIRHHIIPAIDSQFFGWKERVNRMRSLIVDDVDYLQRQTERFEKLVRLNTTDAIGGWRLQKVVWNLDAFKEGHIALKRRLAARTLKELKIEASSQRVEAILSLTDEPEETAVTLSADWEARRDGSRLTFQAGKSNEQPEKGYSQVTTVSLPTDSTLSVSNVITWLDYSLEVERWENGTVSEFPPRDALSAVVDLNRTRPPITVRRRQPKDMIVPLGMQVPVKLKKYLHTHKQKGRLELAGSRLDTVVVADRDEVIWVPGVGLSERIKVIGTPTHRLNWLKLTHEHPDSRDVFA